MEVFYFHCNFQQHKSTLPKMGKFFKKIWHIRWTCPKWANVLQVLGNQIDRGTVIDFHVSNTASTVATGKIWWAKPTQTVHQDPQIEIPKLSIGGVLSICTMSRH